MTAVQIQSSSKTVDVTLRCRALAAFAAAVAGPAGYASVTARATTESVL
jgi:hypothetical protein